MTKQKGRNTVMERLHICEMAFEEGMPCLKFTPCLHSAPHYPNDLCYVGGGDCVRSHFVSCKCIPLKRNGR